MRKRFRNIILTIALLISLLCNAQAVQVNDSYTAQQLVNALVSGTCSQVSNISLSGWNGSSGGPSHGYFTANGSNFPFQNGIILSTGFARSAPGPNNSLLSEGNNSWVGDADLEAALGVNRTFNATVLEFDFIPYTTEISFDYIFASEQYLTSINSPIQCDFTDGFAFLLREVSPVSAYQNLAVVPGTNIPVKVNTVRGPGPCPTANPQYFQGYNGANSATNYNGQTVILKARAAVVPGKQYHIKLVVADQGNIQYDSAIFLGGGSFSGNLDLGIDRLLANNNALCNGETLQLDASNTSATGYRWFKNNVLEAETTGIYVVDDPGDYRVEVVFSPTCFVEGSIKVQYAPIPAGSYTLLSCDDNNDGLTTYNLTQAGELAVNNNPTLSVISYHTSRTGADTGTTDTITTLTPYNNTVPNQVIYIRVGNSSGCYGVSEITLGTSSNTINNPQPLELCDAYNDGIITFDLTQKNSEILTGLPAGLQLWYYTTVADALASSNPIGNPAAFTNTVAGGQTVYARIFNGSDCYGIAELELIVNSFGNAPQPEQVILCENETGITLDAGAGYASYTWNTTPVQNTQFLNVTAPGTYTVTLTNAQGCPGTKTFTVLPSGAATGADIAVNDFSGNNNSITIVAQGIGNYQYSIDGVNYFDEPFFTDLNTGEYTVFIKDVNGCGPIYRDIVYVMDYPRFFTPNGDNVNDVWRVPYMQFLQGATIAIFDRYGKLITRFGSTGSWNGTYNGIHLPSTDYWFILTLPNGRTIKGHFAMLR